MKVKSQLVDAQLEQRASDPTKKSEILYNTADDKVKVSTGAAVKELTTNDDTQTLTNKTLVASSNTITTAASGNLAATELNAALAELQTDIDTRATDADLTSHVTNTLGAHAASAIANTPAGNLEATDVQAALDELQTDLDTRATSTSLSNHINETTAAHAASSISNTPSGNLASVTVQNALNELQSDIDTRATSTYLTTHTGATEAHGATGAVVGTTNTQTLTNKTLNASDNTISNLVHGTQVDNPTSGVHGVTGSVVGTTDTQTLTNKTLLSISASAIGEESVDASSMLDIVSTERGSRPFPRMTEAQRDLIATPATGLMVYNTDDNEINLFNGVTWVLVSGKPPQEVEVTGTSVDASLGRVFYKEITGDTTLTVSNLVSGQVINIAIYNDSVSARDITVAAGTIWPDGGLDEPSSIEPSQTTICTLISVGGNVYGAYIEGYEP